MGNQDGCWKWASLRDEYMQYIQTRTTGQTNVLESSQAAVSGDIAEGTLTIDDKLIEFAGRYHAIANSAESQLEYKVATTLEDFSRVLDLAPEMSLTNPEIPRYRGREGIKLHEKEKPPNEQKASLTSFLCINKETNGTVAASTLLLFPPELKRTLQLFQIDGDYLVPVTYYEANPSPRNMVYLGYTVSNPAHRGYGRAYVRAFLTWLNLFREFYTSDADVLATVRGNFSFNSYRHIQSSVYIPGLQSETWEKIGAEHPESTGSSKFCSRIGMKKIPDLVSRVDLGPVYHGEFGSMALKS